MQIIVNQPIQPNMNYILDEPFHFVWTYFITNFQWIVFQKYAIFKLLRLDIVHEP